MAEQELRPTGVSRRSLLKVGLGLAATALAATVGRKVVGDSLLRQETSSANQGDEVLTEVQPGQELIPSPDAIVQGDQSGFQERDIRMVYCQEELAEVLLRIRDSKGIPIEYDFEPKREVIVVAALGSGERPGDFLIAVTRVHVFVNQNQRQCDDEKQHHLVQH